MKNQVDKMPHQTLERVSSLFVKYGYRSLSMLDIATELAISKKTLYQYVQNKEDLILKVFQFQMTPIKEELLKNIQNSNHSFEQKLKEITDILVQFYRIIHYKCVLDADKFYPKMYQEYQAFLENVLKGNLVQITDEAKQNQIVKNETNSKLVTDFYFQLVESVFHSTTFISLENQKKKVNSALVYHLNSILA